MVTGPEQSADLDQPAITFDSRIAGIARVWVITVPDGMPAEYVSSPDMEVVSFPSEFAKQVELIQRCAELTAAAMPRLQSLDLEEYWLEIGRLEKAGDKSFRRIISKLFSGNYDALEVLKLKDVVEKLEGAINAFETVAKRVEQIAVKES